MDNVCGVHFNVLTNYGYCELCAAYRTVEAKDQQIRELEAQVDGVMGVIQEYDAPFFKVKIVSTSPTTKGIYKDYHGEYVHLKTLMDKLRAAIKEVK